MMRQATTKQATTKQAMSCQVNAKRAPVALGLLAMALSGCGGQAPQQASSKPEQQPSELGQESPPNDQGVGDRTSGTPPADATPSDDHYAGTDPDAAGSSLVEVDIINRCSETIEFCVLDRGVEKNTRLNPSTHERYQVHPGARVRAMDGSFCGDTIYEATEEAKQEAVLCE